MHSLRTDVTWQLFFLPSVEERRVAVPKLQVLKYNNALNGKMHSESAKHAQNENVPNLWGAFLPQLLHAHGPGFCFTPKASRLLLRMRVVVAR